jgi:hypothetical protein
MKANIEVNQANFRIRFHSYWVHQFFFRQKTFTKWLPRVDIGLFDSSLFEPPREDLRGGSESWLKKTIIF